MERGRHLNIIIQFIQKEETYALICYENYSLQLTEITKPYYNVKEGGEICILS